MPSLSGENVLPASTPVIEGGFPAVPIVKLPIPAEMVVVFGAVVGVM